MKRDFTHQLPPHVFDYLVDTLHQTLPRPPNSTPEDLARRDEAAIARILELSPANAVEADLAASYVVSLEHGKDCLRLAEQPGMSPQLAAKCRRQSDSMIREGQRALRLLLKMQASRRKRDADPKERERAAREERSVLALLTRALAEVTQASNEQARPKPQAAERPRIDLATINPQKTTLIRDSKGRISIIMPEQAGLH
jgi:hypothetical protein